MDFRLSDSQNRLCEKLQSLLSGLPVSDLAEPEPERAAPVEGIVIKPTAASGEMIAFYRDLAFEQWSKPEKPGDERLLNIVLACEQAGRLPLDRSLRSLMLASWIALNVQEAAILKPLLNDLAVSLGGDDMQLTPRPVFTPGKNKSGPGKISGKLDLVEGVMNASHLLLDCETAKHQRGLFLVDLKNDSLERQSVGYIDRSRRAGCVTFNDTPVHRIADNCSDVLDDVVVLGRLLTTAELLGASDALLNHACDFVRKRRQFDQAIGNFQSVAHSCAEMFRDVEMIRSLLYATAVGHQGRGIPQNQGTAAAKALASELAGNVGEKGLHLFGAEGLRWHRGLHLLMRRIKALQILFGDRARCEDVILSHWEQSNDPEAAEYVL